MAKGKKESEKRYHSSYKYETNRRRRLERQLKLQPNNKQVQEALNNIKYRRKKPERKEWTASMKNFLEMLDKPMRGPMVKHMAQQEQEMKRMMRSDMTNNDD